MLVLMINGISYQRVGGDQMLHGLNFSLCRHKIMKFEHPAQAWSLLAQVHTTADYSFALGVMHSQQECDAIRCHTFEYIRRWPGFLRLTRLTAPLIAVYRSAMQASTECMRAPKQDV